MRNLAFMRAVRNKRGHLKRAYITCLPGFMRHVVASYVESTDDERPIGARYGMAKQQQLSCGHVWALAGTVGSAG